MAWWDVLVYRQAGDRTTPAALGDPTGVRLASWPAATEQTEWLDSLAATNAHAVNLGGDGYPNRYTVRADTMLPLIPPEPSQVLQSLSAHNALDWDAIESCPVDEWLIVDLWDSS